MSANLTIRQAQMVLPDRVVTGDLVIENGIIVEVAPKATRPIGEEIHASGLIVLPGLIDGHVHLGEPQTETFLTGTRAAAAGGVTSILEMHLDLIVLKTDWKTWQSGDNWQKVQRSSTTECGVMGCGKHRPNRSERWCLWCSLTSV